MAPFISLKNRHEIKEGDSRTRRDLTDLPHGLVQVPRRRYRNVGLHLLPRFWFHYKAVINPYDDERGPVLLDFMLQSLHEDFEDAETELRPFVRLAKIKGRPGVKIAIEEDGS